MSAKNLMGATMGVNDGQIEALMNEAEKAGDTLQAAVCLVAMGAGVDSYRVNSQRRGLERMGIYPIRIDRDVRAIVVRARAECARIIRADAR